MGLGESPLSGVHALLKVRLRVSVRVRVRVEVRVRGDAALRRANPPQGEA